MKRIRFLGNLLGLIILCLNSAFVQAATAPKFAIIPLLKAPTSIPSNGIASAKYLIVNNTAIPRTLTMSPIPGVVTLTGIPGGCNDPFALFPKQSCVLNLQIIGALTFNGVHTGPVICKTLTPSDHRPDPFLCSQVNPADRLEISLTPEILFATITGTPNPLFLSTGIAGAIAITNRSSSASADNIQATLPLNSGFGVTNFCPKVLLPNATCLIYFNTTVPGSTSATVQGSNTNPLIFTIRAATPTLSASPNPLSFFVGGGGTLTVTNNSPSSAQAYALNVHAIIPPNSNFFIIGTNCPTVLAPGVSCAISFNTLVAGSQVISIQGDNTAPIAVTLNASLVNLSAQPNPLTFLVNGTGTLTVTNNSPAPAINVTAHIPQTSSISVQSTNCPSSLLGGASCTINFTAPAVQSSSILIYGTNTTVVPVTVNVKLGTLSVTPSLLQLVTGTIVSVTVTNTSSSPVHNVAAFPPPGSPITVAGNNCPLTLAASASCTISFTTTSLVPITQTIPIAGTDTSVVGVSISAGPAVLAITSPNPAFSLGTTTVQNTSSGPALNVAANPPAGITVSNSTCPASLPGGQSCNISFTGTLNQTVTIPIQGTNTTTATLTVAPQRLTVSPTSLTIPQNGLSQQVTVTLATSGPVPVVVITIQDPSVVSITSNNCTSPLTLLNISCMFQLQAGVDIASTIVTVQGTDNANNPITNLITIPVNVFNSTLANLSVSPSTGIIVPNSPPVSSTIFVVTNNSSSLVAANNIHVTLPASWTDVTPLTSSCSAPLNPGSNCVIGFTSTGVHIPDGNVIISGSNTTTVTTPIAFMEGGGLVYDILGSVTKVVNTSDNNPSTGLAWGASVVSGAVSNDDGSINQPLILAADPTAPAALACQNFTGSGFTDWYLPAKNELATIYSRLFSLGFGNFSTGTSPNTNNYWSSTENDMNTAWYTAFVTPPVALSAIDIKSITYRVRCVRKN